MKRIAVSLIFALLCIVMPVSADETGRAMLRELSSAVGELGRYSVEFSIHTSSQGASSLSGGYFVDGERYILNMCGMKIYGDNSFRYTVDDMNREVVIERMEPSMPMIVVNPATAFTQLDQHFDADVVARAAGAVELNLVPMKSDAAVAETTLVLDAQKMLPRSILYAADGDEVRVVVDAIKSCESVIPQLDEIGYPVDYEVIDLR